MCSSVCECVCECVSLRCCTHLPTVHPLGFLIHPCELFCYSYFSSSLLCPLHLSLSKILVQSRAFVCSLVVYTPMHGISNSIDYLHETDKQKVRCLSIMPLFRLSLVSEFQPLHSQYNNNILFISYPEQHIAMLCYTHKYIRDKHMIWMSSISYNASITRIYVQLQLNQRWKLRHFHGCI